MSQTKRESRKRRKNRIRKKIFGTPEMPRFSIYRSLRHVYAQLIDDLNRKTVAEASSLKIGKGGGGKVMAEEVGKLIAQRGKSANIQKVAFDRNGYIYHGVVQALAESARKEGLQF